MNDDFLLRLRRQPPPQFARQLQVRLREQGQTRAGSSRFRIIRNVLLAFAIVSSAYAGAFYAIRGVSPLQGFTDARVSTASVRPESAAVATVSDRIRTLVARADHGDAYQRNLPPSASEPAKEHTTQAVPATVPATSSATAPPAGVPGAVLGTTAATRQPLRDYLTVATVERTLRLTTQAARNFRPSRDGEPHVETVQEDAQFASFCSGPHSGQPSILVASRKISAIEFQQCVDAGADRIVELKFAHRAIVIARMPGGGPAKLSARDLFLALAKWIPDPADPTRWIANPNRTWYDVNQALEPQYIQVFMPSGSDTLREDFRELVMEAGCDAFDGMKPLKAVDSERYKQLCHTLRDDGVVAETSIATLIPQSLGSNPAAIAIVSHAFFVHHASDLQGNVLDGIDPSVENIAAEKYAGARSLYLYVNRAPPNASRAMMQFLLEYLSDRTIGPNGPAVSVGLISMTEEHRSAVRKDAVELKAMQRP